MHDLKAKLRVAALLLIALWFGLTGIYYLLEPLSNGCIMTYMYPTYIPISSPRNFSTKYGLYLYHEGWKQIDFEDHLKNLDGVPVLFIPGNGGSYKQVRSLAAESERAYQGGPLQHTHYQEVPGLEIADETDVALPRQYVRMLDWFAVDLEGEHSAMDGRILEEHTEYVVHAIHGILDLYKVNNDIRAKEGAAVTRSLPKNVILVGHSMGGFVARAATIHPNLRKSAVETLITLSTPHQSPPVPLQPSLGWYYAHVNDEWRKGYEARTSLARTYLSTPLSNVVVISISGGYNDYQVRSKLETLDGIVPPTHGFMVTSTSMKNVWLSMEHQVILWCNQLVVQVAHTILSLIDKDRGQPFHDVQKRLAIFTKMLRSGIPQNFTWLGKSQLSDHSMKTSFDGSRISKKLTCPGNVWKAERDLDIKTTTVTVLAMDGRRRWLDIQDSNGNKHFVFVTNLAPCSGVRLHLWREKGTSYLDVSANNSFVEVTSWMVHIPSGPAPRQTEPGSQTEQAPPSAVFWLDSNDMRGFKFLTISVAPSPTLSGRPPPATSMGVGQFFSPKEWERVLSPWMLVQSMFSQEGLVLKEDHPLAINMIFSVSLGLMPVKYFLKTTGCGIKKSDFPVDDPDGSHATNLCRLRCFPPVALAWDSTSGLHVFPNLYSETVLVDSTPALWTSSKGSEKTAVTLLVDPHCSYKVSLSTHVPAAIGRFLLVYFSKIFGLAVAVVFFALMRQANAWELDRPIPSVLLSVESNLRIPFPLPILALSPPLMALFFSYLSSESLPPVMSFLIVSASCYLLANGVIILLILISQLGFYFAGEMQVFIKRRWQSWEGDCFSFSHWFFNLASRFSAVKVVQIFRFSPLAITCLVAVVLICIFHPALGLFALVLCHAVCCHSALCSSLMASFNRCSGSKELGSDSGSGSKQFVPKYSGEIGKSASLEENNCSSPDSARNYAEIQLEIFHHRQGLLILHFLAALMFMPSLAAWMQRTGSGQSFPWILDSALCVAVVLHGICDSKPEFNFFFFPFPGIPGWDIKLSSAYLVAGFCSYLSGLALAPYRIFYPMAVIGIISFAFMIVERQSRKKGETFGRGRRRHSHRH